MSSEISGILQELEDLRRDVRTTTGVQLFSRPVRQRMGNLSERYFSEIRPLFADLEGIDSDLSAADGCFKSLHALSRKNCSKQKCLSLLKYSRELLVRLEGASLTSGSRKSAGTRVAADNLIIETLSDICPSAALSYEQALNDLEIDNRLSWRGPATDLREALRETLDTLAPDNEVEAVAGYKPEPDAKRPTMKQKVRYILRNRGYGSGQLSTPETAVEGVEEIVGGLVRSVYSRSSVSTHVGTTRPEVLRVHAWVRVILCELLELPS